MRVVVQSFAQFAQVVQLAGAVLCAALLGAACAGPGIPAGTLEELRVSRDRAAEEERVDDAVAISHAIVDRELSPATGSSEAVWQAQITDTSRCVGLTASRLRA